VTDLGFVILAMYLAAYNLYLYTFCILLHNIIIMMMITIIIILIIVIIAIY